MDTVTTPSKKKFILLGWDAADWKVINPLIEKGLMPNLEKLINESVIGNHATLDPPYSPMLWTSIATGKRPYKHGVLGFHEPWDKGSGTRPVMSISRKCKALWNMLTQKDYKTHVLGWWPSHPAEPINGVAISDFFAKPTGQLYEAWTPPPSSVHPKEMEDHFAWLRVHPTELTSNILELFVPEFDKVNQQKDQRLAAIARETAMAASLHAAFTNILRTQEWDFAALYLATIDHYCHGFMKYNPPKGDHIPQADYDIYKDVVTAGYRFHDMMLGRILDFVDDDTYLMIVSDHGFQPDHLRPRNIPKEPAGPAYEHSPYGIFLLRGPNIKKDELVYGASLLDVTPTILACLDLPVGEDMDGKVLTQVFDNEPVIQTIDSWENVEGYAGMLSADAGEDEGENARMLEQLVELGYIEKPSDDFAKNYKNAEEECNFNLAKSYVDGGKTSEAIPILEKLYADNPLVPRYAFQLATCYQAMNQLKDARRVIEDMRDKEFFNETTLNVIEGSLCLGEGRALEAIKLFKKAESKVNHYHSRLQRQIAQGYIMLRRWDDAERALLKDIEMDYDHALSHALLGQVYLSDNYFEKAAESLLTSLGLEYAQPNVHYMLGTALKNMGKYAEAAHAFEVMLTMMPTANAAREELISLYTAHLNQPEKADGLRQTFDESLQGTIYIVSGLPRSGTSMMMQMLEAGGLPIFTDAQRAADDNNTKGYYEHEAVKALARNSKWLPEANGKVVKIIANLLPNLPPRFRYRIVFMERDLNEVLASQRKMLNRLGKKSRDDVYPTSLMQEYERQLQNVKQWASRHPNVEIMYVQHAEALDNPFGEALRINEFLDWQLLPELMANAVDKAMYRERILPPSPQGGDVTLREEIATF